MSVRGGVEFAAGPPSHAGTTRTTPDSGLGGDERGGPRVPPPGFQNMNQQQMYAGHMIPGGGPPENGNYGPADAGGGDFKRYAGGNYAENECNGPPPGNIYNRMNMNRAMTSAAMQMQQQFHSDEQQQQYGHGQPPGMPPTGPGIYGGPPIHMGANGSAMMAMPPGGPHPGMAPPPHHQQQPFFFWDGQQYHQVFLPAPPPQSGPNQQRPNSGVTSSMSTTTAISSSFESTEQPQGHHMQMTQQQQQQMMAQQQPPPYQQVAGVPPHMFPPQSPQQQFLPNGHPQVPVFMPPGQMYHMPPSYGGYMPPGAQNQLFVHHPGGPMMIRQPDGTITPVVPPMPVMVRAAPPQQMQPNDHFGRPPMMFMQPPHGTMERGQMMPGMYMSPQQQHPQGPPPYGSPATFSNIRNRGGFSSMRGGRYQGGGPRGGRGRNMHTPSSVHSEPRSESVRSDVINNMEDVAEKIGEICLDGPSSPESPENFNDKQRKAPQKQMLQLAANVKSPEEKPCDPAPTAAVAPVAERLKPEIEKEESPADPVVTVKKETESDNQKECTFCKSTNKNYKGHLLKEGGRITCANARENLFCAYCKNRGGENAHTQVSCPEKKKHRESVAPVSRDVTPRESMPREAPVRESSVDSRTSRASVTSGRQQYQGRGGYHQGGHRGGNNDYNKNYRGRRQNFNRGGGRGGGNNSNFQDLPRQ